MSKRRRCLATASDRTNRRRLQKIAKLVSPRADVGSGRFFEDAGNAAAEGYMISSDKSGSLDASERVKHRCTSNRPNGSISEPIRETSLAGKPSERPAPQHL